MEQLPYQMPTSQLITEGGQTYEYSQFTVRMPNGPRVKQVLHNPYPSNTSDAAGNDTDINVIMARFERTGILPPNTEQPIYDDVTELQGDLTEIHQRSREALDIANKFAETWKPKEPVTDTPTPDQPIHSGEQPQ